MTLQRCLPTLAVALLLAVPAAPARAGTVWLVAGATGSDTNTCLTPADPCRTIQGAVAKAQSLDLIEVTAGVYTGTGSEVVRVPSGKILTFAGGYDAQFTTGTNGYTVLSGEGARRALVVEQGAEAEMYFFALVGGNAPEGGGAYVAGALFGEAILVALNRALRGGGIFFDGSVGQFVTLEYSAIVANQYYDRGGGIFQVESPHLFTGGPRASVNLFNVTVSGNVSITTPDEEHGAPASLGGGVYALRGDMRLHHTTFAENTVFDGRQYTQTGAGIAISWDTGGSDVSLYNSIVADGCQGTPGMIGSFGRNIERLDTCSLHLPLDEPNTDPLILPANVYPGPLTTITHELAANSPAVDSGDPMYCTGLDQRSVKRPQGPGCDVGAFELAPTDHPPTIGASRMVIGGSATGGRLCPTLSWDRLGRARPNPCTVDPVHLVERVLGVRLHLERGRGEPLDVPGAAPGPVGTSPR